MKILYLNSKIYFRKEVIYLNSFLQTIIINKGGKIMILIIQLVMLIMQICLLVIGIIKTDPIITLSSALIGCVMNLIFY